MTILIPYHDDGSNGYELKYAIRSMCLYGNITGCLLIGDKPGWYTGDHMPAEDKKRKEWSIMSKVDMAPPGEYLYSHDDIFALHPFDRPFYHCGLISAQSKGGLYPDRLHACITIYPYGMMYDCHTPMVIDSDKYREAHAQCDWEQRDYLTKTIYGNFVGGGEYIADFKVRSSLDKIPPDRPFFSTNNQMAKRVNFEQLYPTPSPYEVNL